MVQHHKVTQETFRRREDWYAPLYPQHCRQIHQAFNTDYCDDGYRSLSQSWLLTCSGNVKRSCGKVFKS